MKVFRQNGRPFCREWLYLNPPKYDTLFSTLNKKVASILITVQRDATQSSLFIILQVHSTCFGCQTPPSSGVHKTVTTVSGTVQSTSFQRGQARSFATLQGGSCTKK